MKEIISRIVLATATAVSIAVLTGIVVLCVADYPCNHHPDSLFVLFWPLALGVVGLLCVSFFVGRFHLRQVVLCGLLLSLLFVADIWNVWVSYDFWVARGMPPFGQKGTDYVPPCIDAIREPLVIHQGSSNDQIIVCRLKSQYDRIWKKTYGRGVLIVKDGDCPNEILVDDIRSYVESQAQARTLVRDESFGGIYDTGLYWEQSSDYDRMALLAHEGSHMFHMTQDYGMFGIERVSLDKCLSDAYTWGVIYQ